MREARQTAIKTLQGKREERRREGERIAREEIVRVGGRVGVHTYMYHIAGFFHGRKLSRISHFCGDSLMFSLRKSIFKQFAKSFLPRKKPDIWYVAEEIQ